MRQLTVLKNPLLRENLPQTLSIVFGSLLLAYTDLPLLFIAMTGAAVAILWVNQQQYYAIAVLALVGVLAVHSLMEPAHAQLFFSSEQYLSSRNEGSAELFGFLFWAYRGFIIIVTIALFIAFLPRVLQNQMEPTILIIVVLFWVAALFLDIFLNFVHGGGGAQTGGASGPSLGAGVGGFN